MTGFTLDSSTVGTTAANGTSNTADLDAAGFQGEGSVRFFNLLGTAAISNSTLDNGFSKTVAVANNTGTLANLTISNSILRNSLTASTASDALYLEAEGATTIANLTVTGGSQFTAFRQNAIQTNAQTGATMAIAINGSTFKNTNAAILTASNTLVFNGTGTNTFVTFDLNGNTFTQGNGVAAAPANAGRILTAGMVNGAGTFYGKIANNTFGASGVLHSGGGDGADSIGLFAAGNNSSRGGSRFLIQNNTIQQYGQTGIQIGAVDGNATIDATILGNTIRQPGSAALGAFAGIWGYSGNNAGDTNVLNLAIGGTAPADKNTLTDSDPNNAFDVFLGNVGIATAAVNVFRNGAGSGTVLNATEAQVNAVLAADNNGPLDLSGNTVAPIHLRDGVPALPPIPAPRVAIAAPTVVAAFSHEVAEAPAQGAPVGTSLGAANLPVGKTLTIVYDATINAALSNGLAPTVSSQIRFSSSAGNVDSNTATTTLDSLTLGDRVWNDTSRDGTFQSATESGVNGVVMNLYADNGTTASSFDAGDTFVATKTTAGGGLYSFTGLLPGNYIVQVAQSNFTAGGALIALPQPASVPTDPDDNIDNDNNGALLAGNGAVSRAITLAYNTEPTAGTGTDTNRTVDFGFVSQTSDLQITKTDGVTTRIPGTSTTYTIVVTNAGPNDVTGATVADTFPAIFTGATWTATTTGGATGFTASGSGNINDTVTIPNGSTITYVVTGTISGAVTGTLSNTATVTAPGGSADPTPGNNSATGTLSNTATVSAPGGVTDPTPGNNSATDTDTLTPSIDLAITKTDGKTSAVPGTSDIYTIVGTNNGPSTVTGATVADTFPAIFTGATFTTSATGGATGFANGSGNINQVVNMPSGSTITYVVTGTISAAATGTLTNTATVTAPGGVTDSTPGNNSATDTDTLTPRADLAVTKTDSPDPVIAGNNVTYTIVLANNGASDAQTVSLSDALPAGTTFVSATQTSGAAFTLTTPAVGAAGTITAANSTLTAGTSATFTIVARVGSGVANGSTLSNTASVTSATTDPTPGNNSAAATTTVSAQADLAVKKTDAPDPVIAGNNVTYTISLTNNGASNAQTVSLSDALPAATQTGGPAFTLTTPSVGGTGTFTATNSTLAAGASATFTVIAHVNANVASGSVISNTATATTATTDPTPGNNSATATTSVSTQADLSITKTDAPDPVIVGNTLTYTLDFANSGGSDARNVSLTDPLPAGTTFVSANAPVGWTIITPAVGGTGTVTFTKTTASNGETGTFTIMVNASPSAAGTTLTNTATVSSSTTDPNPANNSATATTTANGTDLRITQTDGISTSTPGSTLTYSLSYANVGSAPATGVVLTETLPVGTSFVASENPGWSQVGATNQYTFAVGDLAGGANGTATFTAHASATVAAGLAQIANTATIADDTTHGPDLVPADNTATDTNTLDAAPDLHITKTTGSSPALRDTTSFTRSDIPMSAIRTRPAHSSPRRCPRTRPSTPARAARAGRKPRPAPACSASPSEISPPVRARGAPHLSRR